MSGNEKAGNSKMLGGRSRSKKPRRSTTLLHQVAELGKFTVARFLVEMRHKVSAQDIAGRTPLMVAIEARQKKIVELLIDPSDLFLCNDNHQNALHITLDLVPMCYDILKLVLAKLKTVCLSNSEKVALKLLSYGCPLYYAVYLKDPEVTRIMLEHRLPVNAREPGTGKTALHASVELLDLANVRMLIDHGAIVDLYDDSGKRPVFYLDRIDRDSYEDATTILNLVTDIDLNDDSIVMVEKIIRILNAASRDLVRLVLRSNFNVHGRDRYGSTALHYLAMNENPGIVEEIKRVNFDLNVVDNYQRTALDNALTNPNIEILQYLLESSTQTRMKDFPPTLVIAMHRCKTDDLDERVELLLEYGTNVHHLLSLTLVIGLQACQFEAVKSIVGHVVMDEAVGVPVCKESLMIIQRNPRSCGFYESFKEQLQKLKEFKIVDERSLFHLLVASERLYEHYSCAKLYIYRLGKVFDQLDTYEYSWIHKYYRRILKRNWTVINKIANLRKKAVPVIDQLVGVYYGSNELVTDKIAEFFNYEELTMLLSIEIPENFTNN